jgi:hypothetical protein
MTPPAAAQEETSVHVVGVPMPLAGGTGEQTEATASKGSRYTMRGGSYGLRPDVSLDASLGLLMFFRSTSPLPVTLP